MVDESPQVLRLLQQLKDAKNRRVDIILDNSGLELFSDLCFAHALSELLDVEVHLHLKVVAVVLWQLCCFAHLHSSEGPHVRVGCHAERRVPAH